MIRFHTRALTTMLIFYAIGYIYFFILAFLNFPADQLLAFYKSVWIFEEALRALVEYFPVLTVSAVLIAFSTIRSDNIELSAAAGSISKPVSKTLVLFLFFTLIYSALTIGLLPVLWEHRHNRLYTSNLARSYLAEAKQAEAEGELESAYQFYRDYLQIDKTNREVKDAVSYLEGQITIRKADSKIPEPEKPLPPRAEYRNMNVVDILDRAEKSLAEEDPFTAHYLAGIVLDMDESRDDARQLAARAMQQIESLEPSRQQRREYEIYHRKLKGYEELIHRRPIEAYFIFKKLKEEITADRDIDKYYQESLIETRRVSYFVNEAESTRSMPGIQQIVYIDQNPQLVGENGQAVVYINKLVRDGGDFWVHGVEIMKLGSSAEPAFHIKADFGKLVNDTLLLKGLYLEDQEKTIEPIVYAGKELPEVDTVFKLSPSLAQLIRLSRQQDYLYMLNLPALIQILPEISRFGYPPSQFQVLLLLRLLKPFLFLILTILALGLGWRLRIRGGKFPWGLIWVIPLVPFVMHLFIYLVEYSHHIVLSAVVLYAGFYAGLAVLILLEALLLFCALLPIAVQKEL